VLWKLTDCDLDLAAAANTASTAYRIEIDAQPARSFEYAGSLREAGAFS
jgi:hypothetical protein